MKYTTALHFATSRNAVLNPAFPHVLPGRFRHAREGHGNGA